MFYFKALEEKYGVDQSKKQMKDEVERDGKGKTKPAEEDAKADKRKRKEDDDGEDSKKESDSSKPKKRKTTEKASKPLTCINPHNQSLMEAFEELAGYEFKAHLGSGLCWKGITLRKVAKIMREIEADIKNGKQLTSIKGVGKNSGEMIDEFLKSGKIEKLEEFRNKV